MIGMQMSNASLLDESTAAAEAMSMCYSLKNQKKKRFFVDEACHPQNIALIKTRGRWVKICNVYCNLDFVWFLLKYIAYDELLVVVISELVCW